VKINLEAKHDLVRATFSLSIIIAIFLVALPLAFSQEETPPVPADAPPTDAEAVVNPSQAKAMEILSKAAAKQGGEEIVADLKNFRAFFNLEVFDAERGKGNFKVERLFDNSGSTGRMWTKKKHDDKKSPYSTLVHDGEEAWRIGQDNEVVIFTDKPDAYKTDLKNLEDDLRLTRQMFRFFFVRTLLGELDELALVGESLVGNREVYRLEAKTSAWLGDENETLVYLVIHVDKKDYTVNEVELIDLSIAERRRLFVFSKYARNTQGVLVPGNVKIFTESLERPYMQIGIEITTKETSTGKKRIPKIEFNITVEKELFTIPS